MGRRSASGTGCAASSGGVGAMAVAGCLALTASSCETLPKAKQAEATYVERMCSTQPIVGEAKGVTFELDAHREKLKSIKTSVTAEKYRRLSQELEDYSAKWESLNQATQLACRAWALCEYRQDVAPPNACQEQRDAMEHRQESAREFLERIQAVQQEIDASAKAPSITHAVPLTQTGKLSGREFAVDLTVRNPTPKIAQLDEVRLDFYGPRGGMLAAVTEVSGTYTVLVDPATKQTIVQPPGGQANYPAYAWFPSGCNDRFIVKSPIWQTIQPNAVDRFIIKVVFPDDECMKHATFTDVKVGITFNGSETMDSEKIAIHR
ncbi:MAG: hypothetical protein HYY15_01185 [Candidatus Omnitrophica bacterium]|nr:hypothetical protein [Candidatus Omnitrophota bacterium]